MLKHFLFFYTVMAAFLITACNDACLLYTSDAADE